jgi:hypothetical protein
MKTFSLDRYVLLLKKEIAENGRNVFKAIFLTLFLVALFIIIEALNSSPKNVFYSHTLKSYYFIGLFVLGAGFAGFSFPALRKNEKTINYLSLPASALEKYLSYFTLTTIGFFIIYSLLFFILYSVFFVVIDIYSEEEILFFPYKLHGILPYFIAFINLNAVFLLGATIFRKTPPFFTILFGGFVSISIFLVVALLMSITGTHNIYTSDEEVLTYSRTSGIRIDDILFYQILKYLSFFGFAIFFWFIGYLKLKEKEA